MLRKMSISRFSVRLKICSLFVWQHYRKFSIFLTIDKICDQVSDAILDAHLKQDPNAKVACETATKTGMILVFGEITSKAVVDYQDVIRSTIKQIGYDDSSKGKKYPLLKHWNQRWNKVKIHEHLSYMFDRLILIEGFEYKTCNVLIAVEKVDDKMMLKDNKLTFSWYQKCKKKKGKKVK